MTMILSSPDIAWIRTEKDHVAIAYYRGNDLNVYVIQEESCRGHTYIENLGRATDSISKDIGHPLSRDDVFNIAKSSRETILSWSK